MRLSDDAEPLPLIGRRLLDVIDNEDFD